MAFPFSDCPRSYMTGTFMHIPHVGEKRCLALRQAGIDCWQNVPEKCPPELSCMRNTWRDFLEQVGHSCSLLQQKQWSFFLERLPYAERWRILADCWNQVVYLDIETSAVDFSATVTTVSCWDGKQLRLFFQGENLDDFLEYAESVRVFATFNGASFDLPQLCRWFHVPEFFSGIHLDLRWMFRQIGWTGGLKQIEKEQGIVRPADILETRGDEAIELWDAWQVTGSQEARRKLLRYCAADTITLRQLAAGFLRKKGCPDEAFAASPEQDWNCLDRMYAPVPENGHAARPVTNAGIAGLSFQEKKKEVPADPEFLKMQSRLKRFLQRQRND